MKGLEHIPAQHEVSTNRLETLTDGIFAIAMTIIEAGATWWIEFVLPEPGEGDQALTRIKEGPPK